MGEEAEWDRRQEVDDEVAAEVQQPPRRRRELQGELQQEDRADGQIRPGECILLAWRQRPGVLQDHLGGGLQHLRFSDGFWASPLVGRAGIYVNRLGLSAMVGRFRRAGFQVEVPEAVMWSRRPRGPARPHPEAMRPAADDLVARAVLEVRPRR